ncbi:MAG: hypothetical protein HY860_04290 [Chlamydiales bacterium]|nr:hypothetical protein [Chlamydiales bacterium]
MKKYIRRILELAIFCLVFWRVDRFCHSITQGFTLLNIQDPHPYDVRWEVPKPCDKDLKQIKHLLDQPYTLMKTGGQNYAFLSKDSQYVLKVTKHKRMRIPIWMSPLPLPAKLDEKREVKIAKKKRTFDSTFNSYMIASEYFKEFNGIVYLHLNKTDYLHQTLTLVDKIGIAHPVNVDDYEFILQKRGILTYPYIDQLMIDNNVEKAQDAIKQVLRFFAYRISLNIEDHDISFGSNFGFLNDRPFQLDLGSLRFNESFANFDFFEYKLHESCSELKEWLERNHPMLVPTYEKTIAELIQERKNGPIIF